MIDHLFKIDDEALLTKGLGRTLCGRTITRGDPFSLPKAGTVVFEVFLGDYSASFELCVNCLEEGNVIDAPGEERLQCARKKCKNTFPKNKKGRPRKYCGPRCKSK